MHNVDFPYPLYLVLSEKDCIHMPMLEVAEQAILGGVDIIQLREKTADYSDFLSKAIQLKTLTDKYNIPLIINDSVDIANEIGAWGVHVGRTDMPPSNIVKLQNKFNYIGWSLEEIEQLTNPEIKYVHHLGISPVFSTPTKTNTIIEWGYDGIVQIKKMTHKPLIAIGGINHHNVKKIIESGADSIAVVFAICGSHSPKKAAEDFKKIIYNATK